MVDRGAGGGAPRAIPQEVGAAVSDLAADLREWLAWADETGAVELPAYAAPERSSATSHDARPRVADPGPAPRPSVVAARSNPPEAPPSVPRDRRGPVVAHAPPAGAETLEHVRTDLGDCTRCPLHQGRRHIVFGVGSPAADLMLVGEAPGRQEDLTGEPFVGRSGQLLARMLAAIGLARSSVYISNVIKCRPPHNRDPEPHEVACCSPFLRRQILAVRPKVIVALGRFAAWNLTGADGPIGALRQRNAQYEDIPIVATYHPSYLLRTPQMKRAAWEDLLKVRGLLET